MGMGEFSGCIYETIDHEMVVWIRGSRYMHYRRFSSNERVAIQFHIEPIRSLSPVVRNEGRSSPMFIQDNNCDMPVSPDQMLTHLEWVGIEQGNQLKRRIDHVIEFPQIASLFLAKRTEQNG